MEGMEVSGGTLDDGDQDASLSLQTITTGAATDDPASPSSASRQFDCDDEEDDEEESGTTSTHDEISLELRQHQHHRNE